MEIKGSLCVVTGASEGIGRATAQALAAQGARLAVCARNPDRIQSLVDKLSNSGVEVTGQCFDMGNEKQISEFATLVESEMGTPDVLINNAGYGIFSSIEDVSTEEFDSMFAVNVRGLFLMTRAFVPKMKKRGSGHIINLSSTAGKIGFAGGSVYSGTKHAVMGISKSWMLELRDYNIKVTSIGPGSVATEFFKRAGFELTNPDAAMKPEHVADTIVQLLKLPDSTMISDLDIRPTKPASG